MLPTIALAALSGGSSLAGTAAAKALSIGSKVAFVAGAAGNASEEAFKQGASYGQALGYGALSGAIEAGTEVIGGRAIGGTSELSKTILGKHLIKTGKADLVRQGVGKFVYNFVSEGAEEVLSDLLNPVAKRITGVDKDATVDLAQLPKTFLVGGATASILEPIQTSIMGLTQKKNGGKHYIQISEDLRNISDIVASQELVQQREKLTADEVNKIGVKASKRMLSAIDNISTELKAMTEEQRANCLNEMTPIISEMFEKNGDVKAETRQSFEETIVNNKLANQTADMMLQGDKAKQSLESATEQYNKENPANNAKFEVDDAPLLEKERKNFVKMSRVASAISNLTGLRVNTVLFKDANNSKVNAFYKDNVIYMSREHLNSNEWIKQFSHEITHFSEKSRAFSNYSKFLANSQSGIMDKAIESLLKSDYGFTRETLEDIKNKLASGETVEIKNNLAYSELIARTNEFLFTDESVIKELCKNDRSLFNKIKERLDTFVNSLKKEDIYNKQVRTLEYAQKMFKKVLSEIDEEINEEINDDYKAKKKYLRDKKIYKTLDENEREEWLKENGYSAEAFDDVLDDEKQQKQVDSSPVIMYSKKGYAKQDITTITKDRYNHHAWALLNEVLSKSEWGTVNSAISDIRLGKKYPKLSNGIFMIPTGIYEGKETVYNKIVFTDGKFNNPSIIKVLEVDREFEKNNNYIGWLYKAYENGLFKSGELLELIENYNTESEQIVIEHNIDNFPTLQELQAKRNSVERDNNNNQREFNRNGDIDQDSKPVKFSLKDDVESQVKEKYGSTYRWSETGYILKDGTRLDLSGRNEGAPGGYRAVDHRDIFSSYEDIDGTEAMIEFMGRGNIRVSPEYPGINLQVEPTEEQYRQIGEMVEKLGWKEKSFSVDFDNENGETVDGLIYEGNVSFRKVISDIRYYFKEGKVPYQSELSKFRYSLKPSQYESVMDNIDSFKTVDELKSYFGEVQSFINDESMFAYPRSMQELNENERSRIEKVIKAAELEKQAIQEWRKKHSPKKSISLETRKQIEEIDRQYTEAIKNNDLETAKYLVEQMAILKGYSVTDYRIDHTAPYKNGDDASLDDVSSVYGKDIYGNNAARYFGTFEGFDNESIRHIQESQGKPDKLITVYRAVPKSIKADQIRNGDWITLTYQYAANHGKSNIIGNYRIISKKVRVGDIYTNGDSIHEFGYDDGQNYYYRDTENFRKLADIITFDDKGNPIRLKDRFNYKSSDTRYSLKQDSEGKELSEGQREYFKDSKIIDKDGNLLVVYHNSDTDFNVFDKNKIGSNNGSSFGRGFYFATYQDLANDYGTIQKEYYLNIKNPLDYDNGIEQIKKMFELSDYEYDKEYVESLEDGDLEDFDLLDQIMSKALIKDNPYKVFTIMAEKAGYDGVVAGSEIVAFRPEQIKLTTNLNPTENEDIRFSRKPANDIKAKANLVYDSIYTKKETRQIIEDILTQAEGQIDEMTEGDYVASVKGKTSIIETLFEKLNSAEGQSKTKIAREMVDYIINSISVEEVSRIEVAEESFREIQAFRPYLHSIDTSAYSKEIRTVKGNNALILQWGKKGGMEIYDVVRNLQEEGFLPQINLQDAFNDFDLFEQFTDYYKSLLDDVNNASKTALSLVLSEDKLSALKESMAKDLLEMVKEGGELSTLGKLKENFTTSIKELKQQFAKNANYWKAKATYQGDIWRTVADLRGYTEKGKIEKLGSATVLKDPYFKKMLEDMGKITWGGKIDPVKVRVSMEGLARFFNKDNKLLQDYVEATYNETFSDSTELTESDSMFGYLLDQLSVFENVKKEDGTYKTTYLTEEELRATATILKMCKHFLLHYDAIYEDGKRIEVQDAANKYNKTAELSNSLHIVHKNKLSILTNYAMEIMSPKEVMKLLDGYQDGFNTHYHQRFWRDSLQAEYDKMILAAKFDKFFKENKDYKKRLYKSQIKVGDYSLTITEAVELYLMSTQDNGLLTLTEGAGFVLDNERGGVSKCGIISENDIRALYEQFTEKDIEYLNIIKEIHKKGGEFKKSTDIERYGFSNVINGEHYTLTRWKEAMAKPVSDIRSAIKDIQIANNLSFNKSRRKNAKNIPLYVGDSYKKTISYINQIALYKNFSEDLANFDKIYNKNISTDKYNQKTLKMINNDTWSKSTDYWRDLLLNVQGSNAYTGDFVANDINKIMDKARSAYAQGALGHNIKTVLTQPTSYLAAFSRIKFKNLIKGLGVMANVKDMRTYSLSASTRNYNKAIVKSEGIIDKVSSLGNFLTKGIQISDEITIDKLWNACQFEIQDETGLKFGSPENMKKAGLLLDEVISETQPTFMAIDRSALQRSKHLVIKAAMMFTSFQVKQLSLTVGSWQKVKAYKKLYKMGLISKPELNQAIGEAVRKTTAVTMSNIMYAMICQLVKHILAKDDEDDNDGQNVLLQMLESFKDTTIGMFPLFKQINDAAKGYSLETFETSVFNDVFDSAKSIIELGSDIFTGSATSQDLMKAVKKNIFSFGLLLGIPTRNIYNTYFGLIDRFSPSTAYKINSLFTDPKPQDLKSALKKNDTELASTVMTSLMGKKGFTISKEQAIALAELYGEGYSLPSSIPDKITINGEEVALTTKQQGEFGSIYSKASSVADKVLSDGSLNGKTSEVKARTISYIYKYYYYEAQAKALNMDVDSKLYMFGQLIDIQKLASIISEVPLLVEGKTNKKALIQKYLQKQRLSAAQKYILMGYFGYKNKYGAASVKTLINKTNLSKRQKEALLEKCGY